MLAVSEQMWAALKSTQESYTVVVASGVEMRAVGGSLSLNGSQSIQGSGQVVVFGAGPVSMVPALATDPLAPFGQEVAVYRMVRVRSQVWPVPLGVYGITKVSGAREWRRAGRVLAWEATLDLSDRLLQIDRDDFLTVDGPQPGATVWGEVARLSPIPIETTVDDASIPPATVYDSRLKGVETVLTAIGCEPHLTRSGALTARKQDRWLTDTSPSFEVDAVIDWDDEWAGDFYNQVAATSSSDPEVAGFAILDDMADPLSVGRAGGRTYRHSSPLYTTAEEARAGAETTLRRLVARRARMVTVTGTPELLCLEPGDFGRFTQRDEHGDVLRSVLGEVRTLDMPLDATSPVRVGVMVRDLRG